MNPEAKILANLSDFAEEVEIENQLLILARAKKVEQFVDHQEETMGRDIPCGKRSSCPRKPACCWKRCWHRETYIDTPKF